jgi:hypothetical protein
MIWLLQYQTSFPKSNTKCLFFSQFGFEHNISIVFLLQMVIETIIAAAFSDQLQPFIFSVEKL